MTRKRVIIATAAVALALGSFGSGLVYANVTPSGYVTACINSTSRVVTVPKGTTCPSGASKLAWGRQGVIASDQRTDPFSWDGYSADPQKIVVMQTVISVPGPIPRPVHVMTHLNYNYDTSDHALCTGDQNGYDTNPRIEIDGAKNLDSWSAGEYLTLLSPGPHTIALVLQQTACADVPLPPSTQNYFGNASLVAEQY